MRFHRTGTKRLRHPLIGELTLSFESIPPTGPGLSLVAYTAEPGTPSAEALREPASWSATCEALSAHKSSPG